MKTQLLNVYFYALYDEADGEAHSGLTANICSAAVREDIAGNYVTPRYVTIHRIPGLMGVVSSDGCTVQIMKRSEAKQNSNRIGCDNCRKYGDCLRELDSGLECCEDWEGRA